ncbi:hypothetical protein L1887_40800 [Cichorium endivia]|nr:hypothetical protein L1887_40800 [Cichorium endivia]
MNYDNWNPEEEEELVKSDNDDSVKIGDDDDEEFSSSEDIESGRFSEEEEEGSNFKSESTIQETLNQEEGHVAAHDLENRERRYNYEGKKTSPGDISPLKKTDIDNHIEPNEKNLAHQEEDTERVNTLGGCSDTLKILLSRNTSIKEKLAFMEFGKEETQFSKKDEVNSGNKEILSQVHTRITRS